jgi:diguanylate cyclase (GGDEF)-like protein
MTAREARPDLGWLDAGTTRSGRTRMPRMRVSAFTTPHEQGMTTGAIYLATAASALLLAFVAESGPPRTTMVAITAVAALIGVASLVFRRWFSPVVTHLAVATASTLIGLAVLNGAGELTSLLAMLDYVLVAVHVALLARPMGAALQLTWAVTVLVVTSALVWPATIVIPVVGVFVVVCGTIAIVSWHLVSRLRQSATIDPLTGLANRGAFTASLRAAAVTVERTGEPLALALLDLDDFKQVNDRYGHAAGDRVLRTAAGAWTEQLRERDTLARIGGDEFAVVMPGADRRAAVAVAERLARATPGVGCSVGIACWEPGQGLDELLASADERLYRSKHRAKTTPTEPTGGSTVT